MLNLNKKIISHRIFLSFSSSHFFRFVYSRLLSDITHYNVIFRIIFMWYKLKSFTCRAPQIVWNTFHRISNCCPKIHSQRIQIQDSKIGYFMILNFNSSVLNWERTLLWVIVVCLNIINWIKGRLVDYDGFLSGVMQQNSTRQLDMVQRYKMLATY
jgi:hypothetical protein